ncbi:MAG: rRNA maturation RNase YbeY [Hyphomicrobiales bacterium]|nr:rRNA maturation RNase YbeY [Hyphomicrobiales bacterium]
MSKPSVDILVESPLWQKTAGVMLTLVRAAEAVGASSEVGSAIRRGDEICVTLLDDARIAALNLKWRGRDAPTNVLSFPAPSGPVLPAPRCLGDIAFAFETVEREAREDGKTFDDHLTHLAVHGILHLLGHDHLSDAEARRMEALEMRILASIGVADPYATETA